MSPVEIETPLDREQIRVAVADQLIGNFVHVVEKATSTNDLIAEMARDHDEGLVVFAEMQTAARGQYGRCWESSAGGLSLSILLRPNLPVSESARLTDFLARVVAATIEEETGNACSIKAPNDIYIGARKIAGVLVEMRVEGNGQYAAIAGIGLNVNQSRDDFSPHLRGTAVSLALATGRLFDRTRLAIALLRNLNRGYRAMSKGLIG